MLGKSYFDKYKDEVFPEWKPFTSDLNHIRFERDVNKLSYKEWFFGHPSSYKLMYYGSDVSMITLSIGISIILLVKGWYIGLIAPVFIIGISTFMLYRKIKEYKYIKDKNLYDVMIKDTENVFDEVKDDI